jgi:hypothetical protein
MSKGRRLCIALAAVIMAGCAARGPLYQPVAVPDGQAAIYVYRPHSSFQRAGWPNVYVDGKSLYALKNNSHGVSIVPPGRHEVKVSGSIILTNWAVPDATIAVDAKAGRSIYLRFLPEFSNVYVVSPATAAVTGQPSFQEIPEADAAPEIAKTRRSE